METLLSEMAEFLDIPQMLRLGLLMLCYYASLMIIPSIMFGDKLKGKGMVYKFLFCLLVGNFYIINIVLYLALFHVLSPVSLIGFVFGGAFLCRIIRYRNKVYALYKHLKADAIEIILGTFSTKLHAKQHINRFKKFIAKKLLAISKHFARHCVEYILIFAFLAINFCYYSYGGLRYDCFGFGDVYVHLYWTEGMADGNMFVQGIYPFGMHSMAYYIYAVFGFNISYILRFFGIMQTNLLMVTFYCFLRVLCKNRYTPFIGCTLFSLLNCFNGEILKRLQWSLPQESGMFTILPCAIFLIFVMSKYDVIKKVKQHLSKAERTSLKRLKADEKAQIKLEKRVLKQAHIKLNKYELFYKWKSKAKRKFDKIAAKWKKYCTMDLVLFGIAVSLTMIYHFYLTIFAFFLCVAVCCAYFYRVWRARYLFPLAVCVCISMVIAVAPYIVGFVSGIKINYSLRWALGVMNTEGVEGSDTGDIVVNAPTDLNEDENPDIVKNPEGDIDTSTMKGKALKLWELVYLNVSHKAVLEPWFTRTIYALAITVAFGALCLPFKKMRSLGSAWLSMAAFMVFMLLLFIFDDIGLPQLVAPIRVNTFIFMSTPLILCLPFDIPAQILMNFCESTFKKIKFIKVCASALCGLLALGIAGVSGWYLFTHKGVKGKLGQELLQYNAAVECLDDIMQNYPKNKWSIVSVVDETRQVWGYGYHVEIIDFLASIDKYSDNNSFYIPTEYVFFFIEKKPMEYAQTISYNTNIIKFGEVSEENARTYLADVEKDNDYYAEQRPIVMSQMYYWAQEFTRLFPNEMTVFYEDDQFVCYMLVQNEYRLYNMSIDFGYNKNKLINR